MFDDLHLVGNHHDGDAQCAADFGQQAENLLRDMGIQRAGRLVAQQYFGVEHQGAGDGDTLFLTAGQFFRSEPELVRQPYQGNQLMNPIPVFLPVRIETGKVHWKRHVVIYVQTGKKIEILKNHTHLLLKGTEFGRVHFSYLAAVYGNGAGLIILKTVDTSQQGGFSRAALTDDAVDFPVVDGQADVLKHLQVSKAFIEVSDFNHIAHSPQ